MGKSRHLPPHLWRSEWGWYPSGNWRRELADGTDRLTIAGCPSDQDEFDVLNLAVARRGSIAMESNFDEDRN